MPIVAVCPYCRAGGVRAPDRAVGLSATCPKCKSSFTVVPSTDLPGPARPAERPAAPPKPVPAPAEETRPHAAAADVTEPSPVLPAEQRPPVVRPPVIVTPSPAATPGSPAFAVALVAVTLFGVGLLASQFPYGRLIGLGLTGVGLLIGLGCLAAEGRAQLAGAAAAVLNLLAVALLLLAPTWLGLDPWRRGDADGPKTVVAVGHGTGATAPADWVDPTSASWAYGDIRVTLRSAVVGPVELTGPNGARRKTREASLQILIRVANEGVERRVEVSGWARAAAPGEGPRLTDPAGKVLRPRAFEPGWEPVARPQPTALVPGQSADVLLVFEPPAAAVSYLRLELPGAAVGVPEAVKFQLPEHFFAQRRVP